jgi:hypothetical protein
MIQAGLLVYIMVLLAEVHTLENDKGMHEGKEMLEIRIPYLICILRVESSLVRWDYFIGETEATHSSQSSGSSSLLSRHASWDDIVDVWI